jgi:phosphoribosyl 1,2-cyclic phosphodiesterase
MGGRCTILWEVRIRFWGTRGSIATPGPSTVRYGGNTACVELRSDAGTIVVLDCGTGARPLGAALVEEQRSPSGAVLLGHTHWDHIQGLPFFEPLFRPGGRWDLYGPRGLGVSLAQTLAGQMQYQYFPVSVEQLGADVSYHDLVEGAFEVGDLVVRTQYLNHTALTLGYRIEGDGAVVCYLSDHEPFDTSLGAGGDLASSGEDARHVAFMAGADVVIHDAQYDAEEYETRRGWGHSTVEYVVDAAVAAGVPRTVLHHHDPGHDDDAIDGLVEVARRRAGGRTAVVAAAEGDELEARSPVPPPRVGSPPGRSAAVAPALEELASTIVVAVRDPVLRDQLLAAAEAERLTVVEASGGLDVGLGDGRTVLIVDLDDGDGVLERLRAAIDRAASPAPAVLAVTRSLRGLTASVPAITDWLVWPASAGHVRTKLRAAVLRRACRWLAAPRPGDEDRRLEALRRLGVLDTEPEDRFDRFTEAACRLLGTPVALITLVDADRQWFKSRVGIGFAESPRDQSLCAHAILGRDVMQVPDLLEDDRFADNPAVAGEERARFYAGAPIELHDGSRVGTLCVVDHRPRLLSPDQLAELRRLADGVAAELQRGAPV